MNEYKPHEPEIPPQAEDYRPIMAQERKCTTCMYWEQIYNCTGPTDSKIGSCNWSSIAKIPMWLDFPEALLRPQTLGGAGRRCLAWEGQTR